MRSWNVARNAMVGLSLQGVALLLDFVVRTVFVHTLSEEYLGLTALFTSVLSILNLSELGLSTAITFALYRPVAENNRPKIVSLMCFYRNAYHGVGCAFLLFGILLIPFLSSWMHGDSPLVNIYLVYAMYLSQTTFSYWFLAYKSVLLTASQNEYLISLSTWLSKMVAYVLQIVFLWTLRDTPEIAFYFFVGIGILSTLGINFTTAAIVDHRFPYINRQMANGILPTEKKEIVKNVFGLTLYKILGVVGSAASNILISAYVNLSSVGLYANYTLLQRGVSAVLGALYKPFTASIGNLNVLENVEKKEFIFRCLHLLSFWIGGFCGVGMWVLINPFIGGLWLDKTWLLSADVVAVFVLRFLVDMCMGPVIWFREAAGLFWKARYRYILTIVVNLGVSIYLLAEYDMGILGVLLGALAGDLVRIVIDPLIVFRDVFHKSPSGFYRVYFCSLSLAVGTTFLVQKICSLCDVYTVTGFWAAVVVCLVLPNLLWWCMFHRLREYQYLQETLKTVLRKMLVCLYKMKEEVHGNSTR